MAHENIVCISQIEDTFRDRVQGSMTFGYSITKASDVAQGNLGFRATHRTEVRSFAVDVSTILTSARLDINPRWELIKNLFWDLSYYNTFDSDTPSGSESISDYGIVASLGYSF